MELVSTDGKVNMTVTAGGSLTADINDEKTVKARISGSNDFAAMVSAVKLEVKAEELFSGSDKVMEGYVTTG